MTQFANLNAYLSNDTGNKYSPTVITAIITSRTDKKPEMPTHCPIQAQQVISTLLGRSHESPGLERDSLVMLEQIRTMDKARLREYIGTLDAEMMNKIDRALAVSVGLK